MFQMSEYFNIIQDIWYFKQQRNLENMRCGSKSKHFNTIYIADLKEFREALTKDFIFQNDSTKNLRRGCSQKDGVCEFLAIHGLRSGFKWKNGKQCSLKNENLAADKAISLFFPVSETLRYCGRAVLAPNQDELTFRYAT